ncbi:MAG: hypothetical protein ACOC12_02015, partial [Bacteroidota bacterium]
MIYIAFSQSMRKCAMSLVAILICLPLLHARDNDIPDFFQPNLSSPYHAVVTHLHYLQPESYDVGKASLPFLHSGVDSAMAAN